MLLNKIDKPFGNRKLTFRCDEFVRIVIISGRIVILLPLTYYIDYFITFNLPRHAKVNDNH